MALRQLIPSFELGVEFEKGAKTVSRSRAPEVVGFRSGAALGGLLEEVVKKRYLMLDAAPGAGKTTRFPLELARTVAVPVIHVFPFDHMAAKQHDYAVGRGLDVKVHLILDVDSPWPEGSGWVFTSAACVVARWLARGEAVMPDCYLLHDESHESGFASATLRELGPVMPGVRSYVCMTATSGPDGARVMETPGHVEDLEYEPDAFADPWSVEEDGAPWAVHDLEGHILLFEDDRERAQALVQAYNYNGVNAYRFHSRMPVPTYLADIKCVEQDTTRVCAIIADSTFRSNHTFPVSVVVDSGLVKQVAVNDSGKPVNHVRSIYEFERVQSRARGGRCPGQRTRYLRPREQLQKVLCDLGQTDAEAMALVFRALGYKVPKIASQAKMAKGKVPRDLCAALRGSMPLAAIPDSHLVNGSEVRYRVVSDDPVSDVVSQANLVAEEVENSDALSVLQGFMGSAAETDIPLDVCDYHYAEGVSTTDVVSPSFPDGGLSVKRVLAKARAGVEHLGWSSYNRSVAVNAVISLHNAQLMELRATSIAVARVRSGAGGKTPYGLREWAVSAAERVSFLATEIAVNSALAEVLAEGFCHVRPAGMLFGEEEHAWAEQIVQGFATMGQSLSAAVEEGRRVKVMASKMIEEGCVDRLALGGRKKVKPQLEAGPALKIARWFSGYTPPKRSSSGSVRSKSSSSSSASSSGKKVAWVDGDVKISGLKVVPEVSVTGDGFSTVGRPPGFGIPMPPGFPGAFKG